RYGHAAGDEALVSFANVLVESLRKPDDAFRIGGDEFAVLLAEASEDDARQGVARVEARLEKLARGGGTGAADRRAGFGWAARPAQRRRAMRRRSSASPTRPCMTRSGTARFSASSHAPRPRVSVRLPSRPCAGSTEHGKERRCRLSRHRSKTVQKVVLSELDTGERVISERVASVRSVAL